MADHMIAFCPHCSEPLYRSTKPMEPGQRGEPSDFQPIAEHIPPPEGDVPVCFECGGTLKVVPESMFKGRATQPAPAKRPATVTPLPRPSAPTPVMALETLFECGEGENIVNIGKDETGATIILTNRRILRLRA